MTQTASGGIVGGNPLNTEAGNDEEAHEDRQRYYGHPPGLTASAQRPPGESRPGDTRLDDKCQKMHSSVLAVAGAWAPA